MPIPAYLGLCPTCRTRVFLDAIICPVCARPFQREIAKRFAEEEKANEELLQESKHKRVKGETLPDK